MGRVQVEILTYAPTEFYHCQHWSRAASDKEGVDTARGVD
jgi:hypothetical protein